MADSDATNRKEEVPRRRRRAERKEEPATAPAALSPTSAQHSMGGTPRSVPSAAAPSASESLASVVGAAAPSAGGGGHQIAAPEGTVAGVARVMLDPQRCRRTRAHRRTRGGRGRGQASRCGRRSFHLQKSSCSSFGYPAARIRKCSRRF
ncbi:hypothetical protein PVAP13_2NG000600 [Panicum virgatum]|uniref:Uncharacterized protein n=1 Tax=Panicum virgatum TaxID=38727 RepID=A0A8T0V9G1_PANVG|nr:hypothetical protein PVAP13_2NG000600 [Panicum virgatum]